MSQFGTIDQTEYPETDGRPMGETDLHIEWMIRIRDILRWRYRDVPRVYVASNLIIYYEQGSPGKYVVPDDFVVLDCDPHRRRNYKLWEEGKAPDVVFEVTSHGSKREDQISKPRKYARIGVREYFLYDPGAEYLDPPLQGFRLEGRDYQRIQPDEQGGLKCERLRITLRREGEDLVLYDTGNGEVLLTEAEAERRARETEQSAREVEQAARQVEQAARQAEQAAREAAETRADQLQAELDRLRAQTKNWRSRNQ
jgi:Uma2 family endonuclease